MLQAVVCCRPRSPRSAAVNWHRNTQRAGRRSCISYRRGCSDGQTAMQEHLSRTLSRLSSLEPAATVRVPRCLPGLHSIHLYRSRPGITKVASSTDSAQICEMSRQRRICANPLKSAASAESAKFSELDVVELGRYPETAGQVSLRPYAACRDREGDPTWRW
jgi:hypothetical protein